MNEMARNSTVTCGTTSHEYFSSKNENATVSKLIILKNKGNIYLSLPFLAPGDKKPDSSENFSHATLFKNFMCSFTIKSTIKLFVAVIKRKCLEKR